MHLYFFLRGINSQVEIKKNLMQAQWFMWKRFNLRTNKPEEILIQGSLRPTIWGAYEYIFPEEALASVLSILGIPKSDGDCDSFNKFCLLQARHLFGCKRIPKRYFAEAEKIPSTMSIANSWRGLGDCRVQGVATHIIGIKYDKRGKWEEMGYEQEML